MTLRRKKKKDADGNFIESPVKCGICKESTTIYTVHGGIATGWVGGRTCCDACFEELKRKEAAENLKDKSQSEAEHQISRRWGI